MRMRKTLKILHTLASCGLIGGLAGYMLLLLVAPQDTAVAYADLRSAINALTRYLLIPSLAVALVSGLLAMAAHIPFIDQGWVWIKAAMGVLMFEGTLVHIGAQARHAETAARRVVEGAPPDVLEAAIAREWGGLWVIMALSVANVVIGIWRPKLRRRPAGA